MAKLNEFMGKLMAEFGQARALADLESTKIAQLYAKDDLLKHFSVPRFRAQQIELTIPAALGAASQQQQQFEPLDTGKFEEATYQATLEEMNVSGFNESVASGIQQRIAQFTAELESELKEGSYKAELFNDRLWRLSADIVREAMQDAKASAEMNRSGRSEDGLTTDLTARLQQYLTPYIQSKPGAEAYDPAGFDLIVEAAKLRELPVTSLIQVKMIINEEGMEWTTENKDGEKISRLLPE